MKFKKNKFLSIIFVFLVILITFLLALNYLKKQKKAPDSNSDLTSVTPTSSAAQSDPSFESKYKSSWVTVRDLDKIQLHTNLEKELTSNQALDEYGCKYLISAGFYDEEGKHIGLFLADSKEINPYEKNSTFNGFFSVFGESAKITLTQPSVSRLAIQSGPVLVYDRFPRKISLQNDKNARRMIVATSAEGNVIFISVFDKTNPLNGPTLQELPEIIMDIDENTSLRIDYALNLDGGSHSAFVTDLTKITEVANAGGFFCVRR